MNPEPVVMMTMGASLPGCGDGTGYFRVAQLPCAFSPRALWMIVRSRCQHIIAGQVSARVQSDALERTWDTAHV